MNFDVNGIPYFLTYDTGDERWVLLTPAANNGYASLEIHNDGTLLTAPLIVEQLSRNQQRVN